MLVALAWPLDQDFRATADKLDAVAAHRIAEAGVIDRLVTTAPRERTDAYERMGVEVVAVHP